MNKPIVIVDDDADDRLFTKEAFTSLNCKTPLLEFDKATRFIEYMMQCKPGEAPALVLIDYHLPPLNANEVLKKIIPYRQHPFFPVIVFTSSMSPQAKDEILQTGASLVLVKPHEPGHLKKVVEAIALLWCLE